MFDYMSEVEVERLDFSRAQRVCRRGGEAVQRCRTGVGAPVLGSDNTDAAGLREAGARPGGLPAAVSARRGRVVPARRGSAETYGWPMSAVLSSCGVSQVWTVVCGHVVDDAGCQISYSCDL